MAQIYGLPEGFDEKLPQIKFDGSYNRDTLKKQEETFFQVLKEWCQKRNPAQDQNYIGEVITFPVADSCAYYVVAALKPVQLIEIPIYDAWQFQYANRLTAKDVKQKVDQKKALAKLFTEKRKEGK